jgi:hypothetical protein
MKNKITKTEYYTILGLLHLGREYITKADDVCKAIRELVEEDNDIGHCSDAVYCKYTVDELLEKLKISVT